MVLVNPGLLQEILRPTLPVFIQLLRLLLDRYPYFQRRRFQYFPKVLSDDPGCFSDRFRLTALITAIVSGPDVSGFCRDCTMVASSALASSGFAPFFQFFRGGFLVDSFIATVCLDIITGRGFPDQLFFSLILWFDLTLSQKTGNLIFLEFGMLCLNLQEPLIESGAGRLW